MKSILLNSTSKSSLQRVKFVELYLSAMAS
jgi:hypothetical protein